MALRATRVLHQSFDLAAVAQKLTPQTRAALFNLKKQHDDLKRELETPSKELEPIDWAMYMKGAGSASSVVGQIRADFEKIKLNPVSVVKHLQELDVLEKEAIVAAEDVKKEAESHLRNLETAMRELEASTNVDELTIDEVLTQHPEWKKQFQKELAEDKYM